MPASAIEFTFSSPMRLDRFIAVNLVQHLRCTMVPSGTHQDRSSLPILMYHSISDASESGVPPYYRVNTGPAMFARQMELLKANGYQGVTLSEGLRWMNSQLDQSESNGSIKASAPGLRQVAITFDDGLRDFCTRAFPVLKSFGFRATMFLPTAFIGEERKLFGPQLKAQYSLAKDCADCLIWSEIKELHREGIEFGSHTVSHPRLIDVGWGTIEQELSLSKRQIEDRLGATIDTFAYPYAYPEIDTTFVRQFSQVLVRVGYKYCATTRVGRVEPGDDVLKLKRLPVNGCDDDALFLAKIRGDYDWFALPQRAVKATKSFFRRTRRHNLSMHEGAPRT